MTNILNSEAEFQKNTQLISREKFVLFNLHVAIKYLQRHFFSLNNATLFI